jgi:hypothetical protein
MTQLLGQGYNCGHASGCLPRSDGAIIKNHPTYVRTWDDAEIIPDFYNLAQALDTLCE